MMSGCREFEGEDLSTLLFYVRARCKEIVLQEQAETMAGPADGREETEERSIEVLKSALRPANFGAEQNARHVGRQFPEYQNWNR